MTPQIFVFGSNLAGRHGKGAALFAREQRGAIYGCGVGPQGNAYAIPTKDHALKTLPLASIARYVAGFIAYARSHQALTFELTPIGCGLAGYTPDDIAPLFAKAPANVMLPPAFATALKDPEMPQIATPDDKPARLLEPIAQRIDDDARDNPEGLMPPGAIAGFFGDPAIGADEVLQANVPGGFLAHLANRRIKQALVGLQVPCGLVEHPSPAHVFLDQQEEPFLHQHRGDRDVGIEVGRGLGHRASPN